MRVCVTGACGFVGRHTVRELVQAGHEALAFDRPGQAAPAEAADFMGGDIADPTSLSAMVERWQPEGCIHLAGCAYVPAFWTDPAPTFSLNVVGTLNVLQAFLLLQPRARVLVASSAQVYGAKSRARPLRESDPLEPDSMYAISKAAADLVALQYARHKGLAVMTARPHDHIGPGQAGVFAVPAFARQVRAIAEGAPARLKVGNLASARDFSDVRDVARAYRLLIEKGRGGQAYNLASGRRVTMQFILDQLCELAGVRPEIECDPALFRPSDSSPELDLSCIREHTGWLARIDLRTTLRDVLSQA